MKTVRIGIFDEEEYYAGKLSVYLNRMGKGRWNVVAFTDKKAIEEYAAKRNLDILAGTDREVLKSLKQKHNNIYIIWLREKLEKNRAYLEGSKTDISSICRYTSAKEVGKTIGDAALKILTCTESIKPMVAVYSPVGRCGKTSFALSIVRNENFGKWLYIGMEDYSFLGTEVEEISLENRELDSFLYFVKERNQEKIHVLLNSGQSVIPSAFSPFDTKQINKEDIQWLFAVLQQIEMYSGVLFDIGTGILQNPEWLSMFDYILVPFLPEEKSMGKRKQFEQLIDAYGLEEIKEKIGFLNMENKMEVAGKMEEIGMRKWSG